jgi:hypothetical protein
MEVHLYARCSSTPSNWESRFSYYYLCLPIPLPLAICPWYIFLNMTLCHPLIYYTQDNGQFLWFLLSQHAQQCLALSGLPVYWVKAWLLRWREAKENVPLSRAIIERGWKDHVAMKGPESRASEVLLLCLNGYWIERNRRSLNHILLYLA